MSPRTRVALVVGALLLTAACGAPPDAPPVIFPVHSEPPYSAGPASLPAQPVPTMPTVPVLPTQAYPTLTQAYPTPTHTVPGNATPPPLSTTTATTTAPLTKSPTPTPSHAARCTGDPTGAQILTLIKDEPGVPDRNLQVADGPYCSGTWSFTTVRIAGENRLEPLMVATTGKGAQLALVAAGTDVCNQRMQTGAPAGIRVLACGF